MNDRELQPDHEMEHRIGSWLTDTDLTPAEANAGLGRLLDDFPVTPQTRRRFLGRWLERDEGARRRTRDHDRPPDRNWRNRLMFSASAITAALAILALSVSVTVSDPAPPDATAGATHVVALDGSGGFATIQAAVDAAAHGDTVLVRPGTYIEAIVVAKDLTLSGDGPRGDIVITAPEDGPSWAVDFRGMQDPYAIVVDHADVTLSGLTFRGERARIFIDGGSSALEGLYLDSVGLRFTGRGAVTGAVVINGDTTAEVRDTIVQSGGAISAYDHADVIIEANELIDGPTIEGDFGPASIIAHNRITGEGLQGIVFLGDTRATFEGNTIIDRENAIASGFVISVGGINHAPVIEGNAISRARVAINLIGPHDALIRGNTLTDNDMGITLSNIDATIDGNTIAGEGAGIIVVGGGAPTISGNTIDVTGRGLVFARATRPIVEGNVVCGADGSIIVHDGAEPVLGDNEICEETPAE
jgi:parallel beta-helix repeat protein